ncbi:hypothetical protein AGMMS49975_01230 [Clostridia bacterium]|nr:hypothetical protein AGMMS49975_01230 [Clostridia bacterium]
MQNYLFSIAAFLILQSFVRIIIPHSKYQGYVDFVMGLILITIVTKPIAKFVKTPPSGAEFALSRYSLREKYEDKFAYLTEAQNKLILDEYTKQLSSQVSMYVKNTSKEYVCGEAAFDISTAPEEFGAIENMYLTLYKPEKRGGIITIKGDKISLPQEGGESAELSRIKKMLCGVYNLYEDNIHITAGGSP